MTELKRGKFLQNITFKDTPYVHYSIPIDNWRFMNYQSSSGDYPGKPIGVGTNLVLQKAIIFIPNIEIPYLLDLLIKNETANVYFSITYTFLGNYTCRKCKGAGKLDWTQVTSESVPDNSYDRYERDTNCFLYYSGDFNWLFTRTIINDDERICTECLGTGVNFNHRSQLFRGIKRMKERLQRL